MNLRIVIVILGMFLSGQAHGSEVKFMKHPFPGCITEDIYKSTLNLMIQKDWNAVAVVMLSGVCTDLKKGSSVFIEDATITGLVRVRRKGETSKWWTGGEMLSK